jgi:hypothetical protein
MHSATGLRSFRHECWESPCPVLPLKPEVKLEFRPVGGRKYTTPGVSFFLVWGLPCKSKVCSPNHDTMKADGGWIVVV